MKVYLLIVNFQYNLYGENEYGVVICDIFKNKEDAEEMRRKIEENKDIQYNFNDIPNGASIWVEVEERTVKESL